MTEKCLSNNVNTAYENRVKQITADVYSMLYLIIYLSNCLTYNLCWDWFEIEILGTVLSMKKSSTDYFVRVFRRQSWSTGLEKLWTKDVYMPELTRP